MKKRSPQVGLFDDFELEARSVENCTHSQEDETETNWGPPYGIRMTWTCRECGQIRGRCDSPRLRGK